MSIPDHELAVSRRFLRRSFAFACATLLLLGSSANAGPITILGFSQINPADVVTATDVAGTTTLSTASILNVDGGGVSVPVEITNFLGAPALIPAFETFYGVTSTAPAATAFGVIFQDFSGKIEFTSLPGGAGLNYLTAVLSPIALSSPVFGGGSGGAAAFLSGAQPPDSLVLTTDPFFVTTFGNPTGMSIGFSGITPGLSIAGDGSIANFTGQNAGTFSASIVPEPGTLCLASFAVVLGTLTYWRKRMKVEG